MKRIELKYYKILTTHSLALLFLFSSLQFSFLHSQQDVWLQSYSSPNAGCGLSNSELVNVSIYNNSNIPMVFNSITASYSIDGGPATNQLIGSTIAAFATVNFTFSVNANLSACGAHTIKTWVTRASDPNQLNDTLIWSVTNDCVIIPGTITPNPIVCASLNSGALNLIGQSNGTIQRWEMSNDGGTVWSNIANNTPIFNYTNIPQTRQYRVFIEGGFCADAYSAIGTLTAINQPVPGVIDGADSLCITNASGSVYLTGTSNTVLQWESSLDNGVVWSPIANTTYTNNFSNLTSTILYRALIGGGICPNTYSDTAEIFIDLIAGPGSVSGSDSLCELNGNGNLVLSGPIGNTLYWQSSVNNGITWNTIANTTNILNYSGVNQTTLYRAFTQGAQCPDIYSDTARIFIENVNYGGTITGGGPYCGNATGILNLTGSIGTVEFWEKSNDSGLSWVMIPNTTTTESFTGITSDLMYRAQIEAKLCPAIYSDTAFITIDGLSFAGFITPDSNVCIGSDITYYLTGEIGDSIRWENSYNGSLWATDLNANGSMNSVINAQNDEYHRVIVSNGVCPTDTTLISFMSVIPVPAVSVSADTIIFVGDTLSLMGSGGITGIWTPNSYIDSNTSTTPIVSPISDTYYVYHVIDFNGCMNSDSVFVKVNDALKIDIKNVVTMNADGFNDTWIIEGIEFFPNTSVLLFNIYGKEIYSNENYSNEWDGTYKGKKLPNGTYYYVVQLSGIDKKIKGSLTLLGNE